MTYQVIARKWRPQTFEEVTGQEPITRTLRNAVEHNRLHHAYIFSGARGVGKTSTARLFAKALNCHKSDKPTPTFCRTDDVDICPSCREIAEGRSIDVQEIDAASTTGVQNVRDSIIDTIGIAPARDRYKVFIIDEVHMLSSQAFNALLKTLEEPPPRVVFIMATTEGHKLMDTIVSRCQQFEFRTIATARIAERLRFIVDAEKVKVTDEALREIARAGEGSMRDAQSALDQIISFAGTDIKAEDVEAALGIAGVDVLARVMNAIADADSAAVLAVVDDLVMRGHDLRNFCRDFMAYLRDLVVAKASGEATDVLDLTEAERDALAEQARSFSESDLIRFFHSLTETESALRDAAHPRYHLEVGLVKLIEMRRLAPIQEIIGRLNALEESLRTGKPPAPNSAPAATGGPSSQGQGGPKRSGASRASDAGSQIATAQNENFVVDDSLFESIEGLLPSMSQLDAMTPPVQVPATNEADEGLSASMQVSDVPVDEVVADVTSTPDSTIESIKSALEKRRRMFLVTALDAARRVSIEGQELSVEFAPQAKHLRDNLATPDNVKILRDICRELLGHEIAVRISIGEGNGDNSDGPISREDEERLDKQRMREYAEKHPAVQQLLHTFHGEIVDVRRVDQESNAAGQKLE
jgi:DNA polymerase-3 subunit gamma/tau